MLIGIYKKRTTLLTLFDFWLFLSWLSIYSGTRLIGDMHGTYNSVHIVQMSVFSRLAEKMQQTHVLSI